MKNQLFVSQYPNEIKIGVYNNIAFIEWEGSLSSEEYRAGHQEFLSLLREQPNALWLFDYEKGKYISAEDQQWTVQEWFPKAISLLPEGVRKIAVVISNDIFNKVAIRIMTAHLWNHNIEIAFFDEEKTAITWLNMRE